MRIEKNRMTEEQVMRVCRYAICTITFQNAVKLVVLWIRMYLRLQQCCYLYKARLYSTESMTV